MALGPHFGQLESISWPLLLFLRRNPDHSFSVHPGRRQRWPVAHGGGSLLQQGQWGCSLHSAEMVKCILQYSRNLNVLLISIIICTENIERITGSFYAKFIIWKLMCYGFMMYNGSFKPEFISFKLLADRRAAKDTPPAWAICSQTWKHFIWRGAHTTDICYEDEVVYMYFPLGGPFDKWWLLFCRTFKKPQCKCEPLSIQSVVLQP